MKNKMKLISIVAVIMIVTFMLISTVYEVKASNPGSIIDGVNLAAGTVDFGDSRRYFRRQSRYYISIYKKYCCYSRRYNNINFRC